MICCYQETLKKDQKKISDELLLAAVSRKKWPDTNATQMVYL